LTSSQKLRALGVPVVIPGICDRCRLCSETRWAEFDCFLYFKMVAPRALVSERLVKGNKDSGNEIVNRSEVFAEIPPKCMPVL